MTDVAERAHTSHFYRWRDVKAARAGGPPPCCIFCGEAAPAGGHGLVLHDVAAITDAANDAAEPPDEAGDRA